VHDGATMGRDPTCAIQLLNNSVSRIHARFEVSDEEVKIVDLASANGVKVNGNRIEDKILTDKDEIRMGKITMHFEATEEMVAPENIVQIDHETDVAKTFARLAALNAIRLTGPTERDVLDKINKIGERYIYTRKNLSAYDKDLLSAAMREAVGNGEIHGNKYDPAKKIILSFHDAPKELKVVVQDEGPGFDFGRILLESKQGSAVEAARKRVSEGKVGGLGIRLILSAADHVNYLQDGSCVEMVKGKHTGISAAETQELTSDADEEDFVDEAIKSLEAPDPDETAEAAKFVTFDVETEPPVARPDKAASGAQQDPDGEIIDIPYEGGAPEQDKAETWDEDFALTPLPTTDFKAALRAKPDELVLSDSDPGIVDQEVIIEEIEELEEVAPAEGTKPVHSTTWYIRQMEKKRESGKYKINLEEDEDEQD
jgi:anti-sigma regulatory factor (Ser/Thr protein kinase)